MHEMSLIESMLEELEQLKIKNNLTEISDVYLSVGEISGVHSGFLKSAFDLFVPNTVWSKLQMHLQDLPWKIRCNECSLEQIVEDLNNQCLGCQSQNTETIQGKDFLILRIEGVVNV